MADCGQVDELEEEEAGNAGGRTRREKTVALQGVALGDDRPSPPPMARESTKTAPGHTLELKAGMAEDRKTGKAEDRKTPATPAKRTRKKRRRLAGVVSCR